MEDVLTLGKDLAVGKTEDVDLASSEEAGPQLVVAQAIWREVLASIGFDGEPNGWAVEVEDVDADWVLTRVCKSAGSRRRHRHGHRCRCRKG